METVRIITLSEVNAIAEKIGVKKVKLLSDAGVKDAYYVSATRGKKTLGLITSQRFIEHVQSLGYEI